MKLLTKATGKVRYIAHKHGPSIEVVAGVACFGAAVIFAVKASKSEKVKQTGEDLIATLDDIHETKKKINVAGVSYSEKEAAVDTIRAYSRAGISYARCYIPAIAAFAAGTGLVMHSHRIMQMRYANMAAAYTAVNEAFKTYRSKIVDKYGADVDKAIRLGLDDPKAFTVVETNDPETGEKYVSTVIDPNKWHAASPFARFFGPEAYDEAGHINPLWEPDRDANMDFLIATRNQMQTILDTRGWLLLAEVYRALGFNPTKASFEVGWRRNNPDKAMTIIDFGITDMSDPAKVDFAAGYNESIMLDFNCDAVWDELPIEAI